MLSYEPLLMWIPSLYAWDHYLNGYLEIIHFVPPGSDSTNSYNCEGLEFRFFKFLCR